MHKIEGFGIVLVADPLRDELETGIFDHKESCHPREYEKEWERNLWITEGIVEEVDGDVEFHDP